MRKWIFAGSCLLVLVVLNGMVLWGQSVRRSATIVFWSLRPVDPRSLMQGDYLILNYQPLGVSSTPRGARATLRLRLGEDKVAIQAAAFAGEALQAHEILFKASSDGQAYTPTSDSFFITQNREVDYRNARFAEFRVSPSGENVLTGLRDANFNLLGQQAVKNK